MLKTLKNNKAVAVASEYLLVFFLVVGVMSAMTVYFKRVVQARIHDARNEMIEIVQDRVGSAARDNFVGGLYFEYEPYYANTISNVTRNTQETTILGGGKSSGRFRKEYSGQTTIESFSVPAAPRESD